MQFTPAFRIYSAACRPNQLWIFRLCSLSDQTSNRLLTTEVRCHACSRETLAWTRRHVNASGLMSPVSITEVHVQQRRQTCNSSANDFFQITLRVLTLACGLVAALSLGWTTRICKDKCFLYGAIELSGVFNNSDPYVRLEEANTEWGKPAPCNYTTFTSVTVSIYAIVSFWFYVFLGKCSEEIKFARYFHVLALYAVFALKQIIIELKWYHIG